MIKAVIFDLDDTLISEKEYVRSGFRQVAINISDEYKLDMNEVYKLLLDIFEEDSKNVFNRALNKLNISYEIEYIKKLIDIYRGHKPDIKLYDDAKYILDILYKKGIKLGIITDGYKITQRKKLEALNIDNYFECIVVTEELGREFWKPHSRPYEIMKDKLNLDYDEMVYVGDNLSKDFVTANKLGMKTVFINRIEGVYSEIEIDEEYLASLEVTNLRKLESILNI